MCKASALFRTITTTAILSLAAGAVLPSVPVAAEARVQDAAQKAEEEAILAPTLDDLFRDSLKRENAGELPGYVLNKDGVRLLGPAAPPPPPPPGFEPPQIVYEEEPPPPPPPWEEVVTAIAQNDARPEHVAEVERRAEADQGDAVELLAWMRANGVAVAKDLPKAFRLYAQAHKLGVPNARENAVAVYKSMSRDQQQAARLPF
ncbi:hypothetical protein C882_0112 [Caenispirillum salinarum AK4]|uniref:Sel1 repeat family protein n=1 Tax=Caenispirillum salinarum AK4 TaxID=1238182 RepID=K9HND8_9PROT|nr:hypothetical protein [Caenispirillum salinarum]EKV30031.1 hypothetical protein C882_0112 [Caenispirillum salinarum AK4]